MVARRADVAKLAGTSPAVVSYVLNGGPRPVAPATRERVLKAVAQLGYRPNRVASSLRTNRSMTLGLVVPDNMNPYFAELAHAIEDAAFAAGYSLFLGNATDDRDRELAYIRALIDRRVDGIMLIPSSPDARVVDELGASATPWVVLDREVGSGAPVARIVSDNMAGARLATSHLLGHGRTRLACIAGPRAAGHTATQRVEGWRAALEDRGCVIDAAPLREVPYGRFHARDAALDILHRNPDVDAMFVGSDEQALGVLRALAELNLRCPDDVAIVSFDGIAASMLAWPGLSSVRQPREEIARLAVEALARASHETGPSADATGAATTVLPVELIRRGSCGCPDPDGIAAGPAPGGAP